MEEERKDSGVGVVEPKTLELKLPEGGFKLRTGGVLKPIDVAYKECGAIRPARESKIFQAPRICLDSPEFLCYNSIR